MESVHDLIENRTWIQCFKVKEINVSTILAIKINKMFILKPIELKDYFLYFFIDFPQEKIRTIKSVIARTFPFNVMRAVEFLVTRLPSCNTEYTTDINVIVFLPF